MHIHLSPNDGVPIYLQIVQQVKYLVASGRLQPGEELDPIRVLAEQLVINPNTVARAYKELEVAGVVTKRGTAGTYVSHAGADVAHRERLRILSEHIDALLREAQQLHFSTDEIIDLLRQRAAAETRYYESRGPVTEIIDLLQQRVAARQPPSKEK